MEIKYYIADEIREEKSGKPMLIGLYPDNVILINVPEDPQSNPGNLDFSYQLNKLSFLINFRDETDAPTTLSVDLEYFRPNNILIGEKQRVPPFQLEPGKSTSLIIESSPFIVYESGDHYFRITINGTETYDCKFIVRINKIST